MACCYYYYYYTFDSKRLIHFHVQRHPLKTANLHSTLDVVMGRAER